MSQPPSDPRQSPVPDRPAWPPTHPQSVAPGGVPGPSPSGPWPGHAEAPPSKGLAIGALASSLLCCLPIGLVLGIVVLRRGRDGRDHGRALAISAIILSALAMLSSVVFVGLALAFHDVRVVADLRPGDCISADGLQRPGEDVGTITEQDCTQPHDAEVLSSGTLTAEEARKLDSLGYLERCDTAMSGDLQRELDRAGPLVGLLTVYEALEAGAPFVCLAVARPGTRLYEPLGAPTRALPTGRPDVPAPGLT